MSTKKIIIITIILLTLPFTVVWAGALLTGFVYDPREIFSNEEFWGWSMLYWVIIIQVIGGALD